MKYVHNMSAKVRQAPSTFSNARRRMHPLNSAYNLRGGIMLA